MANQNKCKKEKIEKTSLNLNFTTRKFYKVRDSLQQSKKSTNKKIYEKYVKPETCFNFRD